jgi:hypothetical protein
MVDQFVPFDLKITKLTGYHWDRINLRHLAEQLLEEQGKHRRSIENRIVVCFDGSVSSGIQFLKANEDTIISSLVNVFHEPYRYIYWLDSYQCWCGIVLLKRGQYYDNTANVYSAHPLGQGLREPDKAKFEHYILQKIARITHNIRCELNPKLHGVDAYIKLDEAKLRGVRFFH